MTTVFVGGSRHVSRLNAQVTKRIDNMMVQEFRIVVGDANGADKAIQSYLHRKHYRNVVVYCAEGGCRNNLGGWDVRKVVAETRRRSAAFYSAKDRVMALEASVGLMVWDGRSIGTLMNIFRLLGLGKKAVVYTVPEKTFTEFRSEHQWEDFLAERENSVREKLRERALLEPDTTMRGEREDSLFKQ